MTRGRVVIVGSGMMGATLAYELTRAGCDVTVLEKGPDYPYPHEGPFRASVMYDVDERAWSLPRDLLTMKMTGSYGRARDLSRETVMRVGGSGTAWTGLATRMTANDFRTRTAYGFGDDWPIDYDLLEPWMCRAETQVGVSGTDDDNPWAPPRSCAYPMPPFEMTADDAWLAGRLAADGIHVHTTPQARTRLDFGDRPACMNVGECQVCPNGARYSSTHHLKLALATGRCRLLTRVTVRRVITDATGHATGVVYRDNDGHVDREHSADRVIVATAAFESARLLLLSRTARRPDGLGNTGGHVGRHLSFHHIWNGHLHYRERLHAGKVGFWTAQSDQFCDPPRHGEHGGIKIELPSRPWLGHVKEAGEAATLEDAMARFAPVAHCRQIGMHAESVPTEDKYVALATETDRFGDPLAHVHYDSGEFDRRTHTFAVQLVERIAHASGATDFEFPGLDGFGTFAHYMGSCRMGTGERDSVVDSFGAVHDTPGLYVIGLSNFVGSGGAVNPTLTGIALALRSADSIAARLG